MTTISNVSKFLGISWGVIKDVEKAHLKYKYRSIDLSKVKNIAIDEFSYKKGDKYMTVVICLDTRRVLYVAKGNSAKTLNRFWNKFKEVEATLFSVATDMSKTNKSVIKKNLPKAIHVYDKFHIVKLLNEKITDIRRSVFNKESKENRVLFKGSRWLLLKRQSNLNTDKNEFEKLVKALEVNKNISVGYYLKEALPLLWMQKSKKAAKQTLGQWIRLAINSKVVELKNFANRLIRHRHGILNWYDSPISTGPLEGFNNKIKVLKRSAYGYRDLAFFKLKIFDLHKKNYALV